MDFQEIWRNIWQTIFVFISLFIFTRFLGKTQVGQLTFYEYISGITLGSIAGNIVAAEQTEFWMHYFDLVLFSLLTYTIACFSMKSRLFRKIVEGEPTIIIENGIILKQNMRKLNYDLDELSTQLRTQGVLDISEVQFAIFETTGDLSIIKKIPDQPVTKNDLNIQDTLLSLPLELILDGEIITENLQKKNLSRDWLQQEVSNHGIDDMKHVLYAVINSKGELYIQPHQP